MKATLRAAVPADATRVADILIEARGAFMLYAPSVHPDNDVRAWVRDQLLPAGGVTVAMVSSRVVGIMSVSQKSAHSWIDQMSLDPRFVGQRIGSALLAHAIGVLPRPIRLYTFQANRGARRFYERHGFMPIAFTDGAANEERCPDVLYELPATARTAG